jgi:predicted PurR-regulated permease PerM
MPVRSPSLLRNLYVALALCTILYLGRYVFIPLAYGLLVALVLHPMVSRMERRGVPRWAAIGIGLAGFGLLFGMLVSVLVHQLNMFLAALPALAHSAPARTGTLWVWIDKVLAELGGTHHDEWWSPLVNALPGRIAPYLGTALSALFGMLFNLFIIPVFSALLLYHRRTHVEMLTTLVDADWAPRLPALLHRVTGNFARFILGMAQVYLIVGALNCVGFLLLGVPNAILFGMLTAVATMIPYAGIIISSLLPISLAWTTSGSLWMPAGVISVLAVVQYLEANLIFPKVVGGKLGLNTMASLLAIFVGGLIWGVAGMILFLPFLSIVKLIAEEVPQWKPLCLLLGGEDRH